MEKTKNIPLLKVEKENREYAKMLLENYAGNVSALSTELTYAYQTVILGDTKEVLQSSMTHFLTIKKNHMHALGTLIYLLGEKPMYGTYDSRIARVVPYTTCALSYTVFPKEFLKQDLKNEELLLKRYQAHHKMIQDENIKEVLAWMIEDEQMIISKIKELNQVCTQ